MKIKLKENEDDTVTPQKSNKYLAIILTQTHGSIWKYVTPKNFNFSINQNTYFAHDDGTYHSGNTRFGIYLEGCCVPIHHGYIKYETKKVKIKDKLTNKLKEYTVKIIKGLKFDSVIADILLNRGLASEFTKQHIDIPQLILMILIIVMIILQVINVYGAFT